MTLRLTSFALVLLACKPADGGGGDTDASTSGGGDESLGMGVTSAGQSDPLPTSTDPTVTTLPPPTTIEPTTDPTAPPTITAATDLPEPGTESGATDSTPGDPTTLATFDDTGPPGCPDAGDLPHSAACTDSCECASGSCFLIPILGGLCGECLADADCPAGGCTIPDPLHSVGAVCNKGEPGAGCMSDAVCVDPAHPTCAVVLDIPGIITVSTCGACEADLDCPPDAPHCTPVLDLPTFSGVRQCRPAASLANDASCEHAPDPMGEPLGNPACASGFCGEANVMGLLKLGICGECNADADCPQGQTCTDPIVDTENDLLIGSVCQ
jgi:hypothetical protein